LKGFTQAGLTAGSQPASQYIEVPAGSVTGEVRTTDGKPAAFVTIYILENSRTVMTDGNGQFSIKNLKEGSYTLQVSMVGLKPVEQRIDLKKDESATVSIVLQEDARQLEDVVITSGRRLNNKPVSIGKIAINPMDLPQSITVVGSGIIREQQAQRLSDVVRNVNGVYVTTTRGNVQESFGARGYGFGSSNLFKNGARINSGAMPEMSSIERVEVMKGSSAILFGQVAPGGIMNLVTKQPKFKAGGEVSMRIGSYDLYKPAFDIYGPLSKSIAYRLNGTYENAGSFRDGVSSERYYVNPSFLFKLGKKTDLTLEGDYLYHEFTPDFGIGTIGDTIIPDVPRSRFLGTPWQYSKTTQYTTTATLNTQLNENWKFNTAVGFQHYDRDYFSVERVQAQANGDWNRPLGKVLTAENYYNIQANLTGKFATGILKHEILAGADADHYLTTANSFTFPAVAGLPANAYDKINILDPGKYSPRTDMPHFTNTTRTKTPVFRTGIYAQDLIRISEKFNFLAGLRWSYVETKAARLFNLATNAVSLSNTNRYDQAFSPRLGLVYKPFKSTSFFASYSNSFVVNTGIDVDSNAVKPSIIDQYEVGVKNEFFNGLLSANVTVYRIVNNNLAQTAPFDRNGNPNNNTNIKQLTGETTSEGVEVDLAAHPIKGLDINAGYSYNYMRYTKTDNTIGSFKQGERLVNNPAHTANASVFYTITGGLFKRLKAGFTAVYIGERFGGWNTDLANIGGVVTERRRKFAVDAYSTIDISLGYSYRKFSVMGKVSNLTNSMNYYVHENYSVNPIPPTQFMATVSYKF